MTNIPIKKLLDKDRNAFVPFTVTKAVFVPNSDKTVDDVLEEALTEIEDCPNEALTNNDIDSIINDFADEEE